MPGILFKVWSLTEKKMVFASTMHQLITAGRQKLGMTEEKINLFLQDGTEIDGDDILQALEPQTVIYLLHENDEKPWQQTATIIPVEDLSYNFSQTKENVSVAADVSVKIPIEEETVHFDITSHLRRAWPQHFQLPVDLFSEELVDALKSGNVYWRVKNELLGHISREIMKYTMKPSSGQRDQVARELILLFPMMKSNIGEGHHGWSQKIYDRMCEENKRNGSTKRQSSSGGVKAVKLPRRGEINFSPNVVVSEEIVLASKEFLAEEFRKPVEDRDKKAVAKHLSLTFSDRRQLIMRKSLVGDLKGEYPILFSEQGVLFDFSLLNGFQLEPRFTSRLHLCAEKVRDEALLMKKKSSEIQDVLKQHFDNSVTALRLLPHLVGDKDPSYIYRFYPFETDINIIKTSGPKTPHVAALGDLTSDCLCFIVVEDDAVISVHGFVKAVILMFGMYYCCNMEYATEVCRTLKFIQTYLLHMDESRKLPAKLITFTSKMP